MAVIDEIVDLYSSILNGTLSHYAGIVGGKPVDLLVKPALEKAKEDHRFLESVDMKQGKLQTEGLSADIEVMKNGFNALTKAIVDSLGYVFGPDEVVKETKVIYRDVSKGREQLIHDAKIAQDLPSFLSEETWEEV